MKSFTDDLEFAAWASRPFGSSEAEQAAFRDPRYKTSADWRAAVAAKVAVSANGIEPKTYNESKSVEIVSGGIGAAKTEAGAQLSAELTDVDQQMIEQYGRQSIAPPPKVPKAPSAHVSQWANADSISISAEEYPEQ